MIKFSVLMSIYHKESPNHFDECMLSLWDKQILKPNEIVLVADGQLTVDLDKVIVKWQSRLGHLLRVIRLPNNVGTGLAKNEGLKHCSFEIVCIADTDDVYPQDRFVKQMTFLAINPDVDIIGGQMQEFVLTQKQVVATRQVPIYHDELVAFACTKSPFNNITIAYRKSAVLAVGGYEHHLFMEDYNLFLRLISAGCRLHNLPDVLAYARIDNGMHSRRKGMQYLKSERQLFELKVKLGIQRTIPALGILLMRCVVRLLPATIIQKIYRRFLRK